LVFLGNPGKKYAKTRHNAGRMLAARLPFPLSWRKKGNALFAALPAAARDSGAPAAPVYCLQPESFMNLSGIAAAEAAAFYRIPPECILVVHDELELAPGSAALKYGGGLGGHNGLRSIKSSLGSADFQRLRIGIGRPPGEKGEADVSGWVLSGFTPEELPLLERALDSALGLLLGALDGES
jgi:PTH1 family peptidyl-tRNA hydrolase